MDKSAFQFNKNDVSRTIVCFGSPLLDSIVRVDGAFLKAHSLGANSAQLIEEASFFEKVLAKKCKVGIGGSVTNTARVLQAVLKRKRAVTYVGAIGSDADGRTIKRTLEDEGVRCVFKECRDASTGRCAVLVHGDKRSLCTDLGASKLYSLEDFNDARLQNCLALATSVYISAFFLGVSVECVNEIVRLDGKLVAFNIGAPFLCEKFPKEILEVLEYVDVVFGNDHEARALFKIINSEESEDIKTVCAKIRSYRGIKQQERLVVVTRGAESIFVASKNGIEEFEVAAMSSEDVVDTNGAGDAFVGGFLGKYLQGYCVEEAVRCGIVAAQEIVKNVGCCFDKDKMYLLCQ